MVLSLRVLAQSAVMCLKCYFFSISIINCIYYKSNQIFSIKHSIGKSIINCHFPSVFIIIFVCGYFNIVILKRF